MTVLSIPHSSAKARPVHITPALSCDAHLHILDSRLDPRVSQDHDATVEQYLAVKELLGTQRAVVVQPRLYGTDHRVTLDAIARLGAQFTRGIAVVRPEVSELALQNLHDGGIRGVRMSLHTSKHAVFGFDMLEPLAHRVHAIGWHLQLHWTPEQLVQHASTLLKLPVTVVFDHLARLPVSNGIHHPAFSVVRELLQRGRAWVKLSGAYLNSTMPYGQGYDDVQEIARAWVDLAPDRLVWGSDWPHTTEPLKKPDDSALFDLLYDWTGDTKIAEKILVDNPNRLYGFDIA